MNFRDGKDGLNQVENVSKMLNLNMEKSDRVEGSAYPSLVYPLAPSFRPCPYSMWSSSIELLSPWMCFADLWSGKNRMSALRSTT